jgi:putative ABC transport system ATP-binding protein
VIFPLTKTESIRACYSGCIGRGIMKRMPADPSNAIFVAHRLTKIYHMGEVEVHALRGIDLTLYRGELVVLLGPSGSGKSTMMNLIGCLDRPSSGEVKISGAATKDLSDNALTNLRSKSIGFVFQQFQLLPNTTALENVMAPLLYQGINSKEAKRAATKMLSKLGLAERLNFDRNRLSGGQQQRVAIARALVTGPDIVLADEPTGALDSKTGAQVIGLLKELNAEGRTIILITHDLEIAASVPRRVFLRDGKVERDERDGVPGL